ncbi:MAG: DUF5123 domain-containing protein [Prevotella sp.]
MKIKNILYIAAMGLTATACTDGNDWGIDSAYDRLFGINSDKISVTAEDLTAEVSFSTVKDAEYYIIEVSTDSLYDDVAMGGSNSIVFGANKEITTSPYTLNQLVGDTRYYLRMKSMADGRNDSKWCYYKSGQTFKTKAEQIFYEITDADRFEDHVNLKWNAEMEATNIVVMSGEEEVQNITLDAAAKAAGELTVTGLKASTAYTFIIYNGTAKRGTVVTTTTAAMPSGDFKIQLPATITALDQDIINDVVAQAQAAVGADNVSVTIGIPAGLTLDARGISAETGEATGLYIPDGVSVTFFGLSGGDTPVLNIMKSFNIKGSHNYLRFENVNFTDGGCQYFINQSADAVIAEDLTFTQCRFEGFDRSVVRTQGSPVITIGSINLNNCVLTNMSKGNGYSVFQFKLDSPANQNIGSLNLSNCTFDTAQRSFIETSASPLKNGITITDCTFYNVVQSGRYLIDANGQPTDITLKNTILGKTYVDTAKGVRTAGSITIENCLRASDCIFASNDIKELDASDMSSADIFSDPANHDFTLKINQRIGDPRWFPVE